MGRYKVVGRRDVEGVEPGQELEHEFTAEQETEHLGAGRLELAPTTYRVIGGSAVHGIAPGDEGELTLPAGQRDALIEGGHIEPVKRKPKASAGGKKGAKSAASENEPNEPKEAK